MRDRICLIAESPEVRRRIADFMPGSREQVEVHLMEKVSVDLLLQTISVSAAVGVAVSKEETLSALVEVAAARRDGDAQCAVLRLDSGLSVSSPDGRPSERQMWSAACRSLGFLEATGYEALIDLSCLAASGRSVGRAGMGIVTFGGGSGVVAADLCDRFGLSLADPSASTLSHLKELAPPIASLSNPFDLTPAMYSDRFFQNFPAVLDAICEDPSIEAVYLNLGALASAGQKIANAIADANERTKKLLCVCWMPEDSAGTRYLASRQVPVFVEPLRAISSLAKYAQLNAHRRPVSAPVAAGSVIHRETSLGSTSEEGGIEGLRLRLRVDRHPLFGQLMTGRVDGRLGLLLDDVAAALNGAVAADPEAFLAQLKAFRNYAKFKSPAPLSEFHNAVASLAAGRGIAPPYEIVFGADRQGRVVVAHPPSVGHQHG